MEKRRFWFIDLKSSKIYFLRPVTLMLTFLQYSQKFGFIYPSVI